MDSLYFKCPDFESFPEDCPMVSRKVLEIQIILQVVRFSAIETRSHFSARHIEASEYNASLQMKIMYLAAWDTNLRLNMPL